MSHLTRRTLVRGAAGLTGVLTIGGVAACSRDVAVAPAARAVVDAEKARRRPGAATVPATLTPAPAPVTLNLGGRVVTTWAYGDSVPGPLPHVTAGVVLSVDVDNRLPAGTIVHWHGIPLRTMDGVPGMTQDPIDADGSFRYEFTVPDPGTYIYHPHSGAQLDHGSMRAMAGEGMQSAILGGPGDVDSPHHLVDERTADSPVTLTGRPGQRVRIRFVNAGSDTTFRVALGGHRMTLTHSDGFLVVPVPTDALLIGMGDRFDVTVTLADGVFPFVAAAEGKSGRARGRAHRHDVPRGRPAGEECGGAGAAAVRQPRDDVPPDAPARAHLRRGLGAVSARTPWSCGRCRPSMSTSTPTTPASGQRTATTSTLLRRA